MNVDSSEYTRHLWEYTDGTVFVSEWLTRARTALVTLAMPAECDDILIAGGDPSAVRVGHRVRVADRNRGGWLTLVTEEYRGEYMRGGEWVEISTRKCRSREVYGARRVTDAGLWLMPGWSPNGDYLATLPGARVWTVTVPGADADRNERDAVSAYLNAATRCAALVEWRGGDVYRVTAPEHCASDVSGHLVGDMSTASHGATVLDGDQVAAALAAGAAPVEPVADQVAAGPVDADGTPIRHADAVLSLRTGHAGIVSSVNGYPAGATVMIMWAGSSIVETAAPAAGLRVMPDALPGNVGPVLVTRARALTDAMRAGPVADQVADALAALDGDQDADSADTDGDQVAPVEPTDAHGCPMSNVNAYGRMGHRVGCPDHAEPTDAPAVEPAPHRVDQVAEVPADGSDILAAIIGDQVAAEVPADSSPAVPFAVRVERDALADALAVAVAALPKRVPVPVLSGVLLVADGDTLDVSTFDYELSTRNRLAAEVSGAGRVLVAARDLREMVRKFPKIKNTKRNPAPAGASLVTLRLDGDALAVEYGPAALSLPVMPVGDYPTIPDAGPTVATLDAGALAVAAERAALAVGTDLVLPVLTGMYATPDGDALRLATTDRYRAAFAPVRWSLVGEVLPALIPGATLAQFAKVFGKIGGTVEYGQRADILPAGGMAAPDGHAGAVSLTCGPLTITTKCLYGEFPRLDALVPADQPCAALVEAAALAASVERVASILTRKSTPVRLVFASGAGEVTVTAVEDGRTARETVACEYVGDALTAGFNPAYLRAALATITRARIGMFAGRPSFAATVRDADTADGYTHLLMTVRIDQDADSAPAVEPTSTPAPADQVAATDQPDTDAPASDQPDQGESMTDQTSTGDQVAAPAIVESVERDAERAHALMAAGDYAGARAALNAAEAGAPAGYLVAGRHPFDVIFAAITAAESAARAVADSSPAPVAVDQVDADSVPAVESGDALASRVREIVAGGTWSADVVRVGKGRAAQSRGVDVLTLAAGRLDRDTYTAVRDALRPLGGAWNRAAGGFIFDRSEITWNGTAAGGRTPDPRAVVAAWLTRAGASVEPVEAPASVEPVAVEAPAPVAVEPVEAPASVEPVAVEAPAPVAVEPVDQVAAPVADSAGIRPGMYARIHGTNGHGEPLTVEGYVLGEPVETVTGARARVRMSATLDGPGRMVYVGPATRVDVLDAPAVDQVDAPAVAVEPVADSSPAPVALPTVPADTSSLTDAQRAALARAYADALAALTGAAPVADQVPAVEPVAVESVAGPMVYRLPAFSASGMSYRAARTAVRDALRSAGIRARVEMVEGDKRAVTVAVDQDARERAAAIVADALAEMTGAPVA